MPDPNGITWDDEQKPKPDANGITWDKPAAQTFQDTPAAGLKSYWEQVNPIEQVKGLAGAIAHPNDFLRNAGQQQMNTLEQGAEAYGAGDYPTAIAKAIYGLLPLVGPQLAKAADEYKNGQNWQGTGTMLGVGTNVAMPQIIKGVSNVLPKAAASVGENVLQPAAERLYKSALKPSTRLSVPETQSVVQTGLEEGIPVNAGGSQKLAALVDDLNRKVQAQIASTGDQRIINNQRSIKYAELQKAKFANQVNPTEDLAAIDKSIQDFRDTVPEQISATQAQNLKTGTYQQLGNRAYGELKSATIEAQKALARGLKDELNDAFPELKGLNAREAKAFDLQPELERAVQRASNHQLIGLGTPMAAVAGDVIGGAGAGAAAGAIKAIIDNPAIKSKIAIALSKASRGAKSLVQAKAAVNGYISGLSGTPGVTPTGVPMLQAPPGGVEGANGYPTYPRPWGGATLDPDLMDAQIVHHGTPHTFDKFDMSKVGTGEGAQAYGHGLYFAENEGVARSYRPQPAVSVEEKYRAYDPEQSPHASERLAGAWIRESGGDVESAIKTAEDAVRRTNDSTAVAALSRLVKWQTDNAQINTKPGGNIYPVSLPRHAVANMLDWDKPLSEQSPQVQDALKSAGIEVSRNLPWVPQQSRGKWHLMNRDGSGTFIGPGFQSEAEATAYLNRMASPTGEKLYSSLGDKTAATAKLRELGIPGIRYLDQGSRGAGEGTYNYVVFDDSLPKILKPETMTELEKEKARAASGKVSPVGGWSGRLFHGTKSDFDAFDLSKAGASDPGLVGQAVYFTPTKAQAEQFASNPRYGKGNNPRVIESDVQLRNPVFIDDGKLPDGRSLSQIHPNGISKDSGAAIKNELVKQGYDGAVFRLGGEVTQVAVFDPTQAVKTVGGSAKPNKVRAAIEAAIARKKQRAKL